MSIVEKFIVVLTSLIMIGFLAGVLKIDDKPPKAIIPCIFIFFVALIGVAFAGNILSLALYEIFRGGLFKP